VKKERIFKEELIEKRPPLYIYKARIGDKKIYLNEVIPYFATTKDAVAGFIKTVNDLSDAKPKYIVNISRTKKKGTRIVSLEMFYAGLNLEEFIRNEGTLNLLDSISLIATICKAFQEFHSRKVFGIGIEQKNIIVKNLQNIKIIHPLLPIAEKYLRKSKRPEMLNPLYLAPEQIEKNIADEKSDLFNIGTLLFLIINSKHPSKQQSSKDLIPENNMPYCVNYITKRLLEKKPSDRFSSINSFLDELSLCRKEIQLQKSGDRETLSAKHPAKEIQKQEKIKVKQVLQSKTKPKRSKKAKRSEKIAKEKPTHKAKPLKRMPKTKKRIKLPLSKKTLGISVLILFTLIICLIVIPKLLRTLNPYKISSFSVLNNTLTTMDDKGKVLWKFKVGSDISFSKLVDFDKDNRNEVILGTTSLLTNQRNKKVKGRDNARFYILNENGKILYSQGIGCPSIYSDGSSNWSIYDLEITNCDDKGINNFVALAITNDSLDCILFLRNEDGKSSKFWHTGRISNIIPLTLKDNGKILLCAGENTRMGKKPVVFALKQEMFNDQSPPCQGDVKNQKKGLLWYRFEPGSGTVKNIGKKDSVTVFVQLTNGTEKLYETESGYEINEHDTCFEMFEERGQTYDEAFRTLMNAEEYKRKQQFDLALSTYDKASNIKTEDVGFIGTALFEKALLYFEQKEWRLSSIAFNSATKIDPLICEAFYRLGLTYSEREQFSNAIVAFRKAFKLSGKEEQFYKIIDLYTAIGKYKTAKKLLSAYEKNAKNKLSLLMHISKVNREEGNFKTAAVSLENLVENFPKSLNAKILLADIYADMDKNLSLAESLFNYSCNKDSMLYFENVETSGWISYRKSSFGAAFKKLTAAVDREEKNEKIEVSSRTKLPRLYYRTAIIAQTLGKKDIKEVSIEKARKSKFCKGYIKRQLNYLLASP